MCDFVCQHFGARYPDAVCIDGYLWDADSGDSDGGDGWLYAHGGDDPCPACNRQEAAHALTEQFYDQRPEWAERRLLAWPFWIAARVKAWRCVRRFVTHQSALWSVDVRRVAQ